MYSSPSNGCEETAVLPIEAFVATMSLEDLTEIVVTDTKIEQSSRSVTQRMHVIDKCEFERMAENRRNLAELIQYTSGQFVNVLSRNDANWGSYAGLGAKYNTYMLDGLPIDSFADAMSLDPWAFERIELQKGPASILYSNYLNMDFAGTESPLAGTTNFILKDRIDAPLSRARLSAGSYDTQDGRFYHQNRIGDLSYFFGGSAERSDYTQYGETDSWLQTTEKPDYRKTKVYAKVHWEPLEGQSLSLFLHQSGHTGDLGRPQRDFDHRYRTLNLKYNAALSDALLLQAQGGWRNYDRRFGNDDYPVSLASSGESSVRQSIIPLDLTLSYLHGSNSVLTVGSDAQWTDYKTSEKAGGKWTAQNRVQARSNSLFLQEKAVLGEWVVRGGLRYNRVRHDYEKLGGISPETDAAQWSETLWNLGVRWNMNPTLSWYANTGSGFMTPSAKQVGGTITDPLTDSGQLPNGSLRAERGMGSDIGFEWTPLASLIVGVRAYYNTIDDAIVDNVENVAPSQTRSTNAGEASTRGIEVDLRYRHDEGSEFFANFTYNDTRIDDPMSADTDGTQIPFVPRYVANLGVSSRLPLDIRASLFFQRVGTYYDSTSRSSRSAFGGYHVFNATLQKRLADHEGYEIDAFIGLNNLGDRRYAMPWGFVDTGFNAQGGVSILF